jgi:hypothetical protein
LFSLTFIEQTLGDKQNSVHKASPKVVRLLHEQSSDSRTPRETIHISTGCGQPGPVGQFVRVLIYETGFLCRISTCTITSPQSGLYVQSPHTASKIAGHAGVKRAAGAACENVNVKKLG